LQITRRHIGQPGSSETGPAPARAAVGGGSV